MYVLVLVLVHGVAACGLRLAVHGSRFAVFKIHRLRIQEHVFVFVSCSVGAKNWLEQWESPGDFGGQAEMSVRVQKNGFMVDTRGH